MAEPLDPHVVGLLREQLDNLRELVLELWLAAGAPRTGDGRLTKAEGLDDDARLEVHDKAHDVLELVEWCRQHCAALTLAFVDAEKPRKLDKRITRSGGRVVVPFPSGDAEVPQ